MSIFSDNRANNQFAKPVFGSFDEHKFEIEI
jgi:hypothetical protein